MPLVEIYVTESKTSFRPVEMPEVPVCGDHITVENRTFVVEKREWFPFSEYDVLLHVSQHV